MGDGEPEHPRHVGQDGSRTVGLGGGGHGGVDARRVAHVGARRRGRTAGSRDEADRLVDRVSQVEAALTRAPSAAKRSTVARPMPDSGPGDDGGPSSFEAVGVGHGGFPSWHGSIGRHAKNGNRTRSRFLGLCAGRQRLCRANRAGPSPPSLRRWGDGRRRPGGGPLAPHPPSRAQGGVPPPVVPAANTPTRRPPGWS